MPDHSPSYSQDDPTLYLFTSLTAGSSHIITATSRLETILKANKIAFRAIDAATDDKARTLWGRKSKGRKLPGLDIEQIEEWNEYGELQDQLRADPSSAAIEPSPAPSTTTTSIPSRPTPVTVSSTPHIQIVGTPSRTPSAQSKREDRLTLALRQASEEAAAKAKETARVRVGAVSPSSMRAAEQAVAAKAVEERSAEPEVPSGGKGEESKTQAEPQPESATIKDDGGEPAKKDGPAPELSEDAVDDETRKDKPDSSQQ
ncbi:predicted protein [Uncinocarpus reesii 1704]|uniref:Uncharacterized protein n=1 Tax=Uncinocarpus reesii (strain UAMH 1704) TaxID=336963 RepID=C4JHH0_UNCRE|nr:uncharacterized protein UREG_01333 [Uncinocarpus reesii 1704]EEP76484.1 predicted protein [Uncinocarpus reesii 1704]